MKNLRLLNSEILANYPKHSSFAIIGNAGITPSEQKIIDGCDGVIRFNNYATREGIDKPRDPYRCDILFSTFDLHSAGSTPSDVVIGIPFPFKAEEICSKPSKWYPGARHWMVDPYKNMKMCKEMQIDSLGASHPLPSIGFTALYHLHNWPIHFYVCGFNWYFNKETGRLQGKEISDMNFPKNWNHCYMKECLWIIKNLMSKNNIIFSPDCLWILNYIKKKLEI